MTCLKKEKGKKKLKKKKRDKKLEIAQALGSLTNIQACPKKKPQTGAAAGSDSSP